MSKRYIPLGGSSRNYIDRENPTADPISRRERDTRVRQAQAASGITPKPRSAPKTSDRFIPLGGKSRNYIDKHDPMGDPISRREKQKREGKPLPPKRRPDGERKPRTKPFPEEKKLPDEYFSSKSAAKTHRWYSVKDTAIQDAPKRVSPTQRFQLVIVCDVYTEHPKVKTTVEGYSRISYKWWHDYKRMREEAIHSASFRVTATSGAKVLNIRDERIIVRQFRRRTKRNDRLFTGAGAP